MPEAPSKPPDMVRGPQSKVVQEERDRDGGGYRHDGYRTEEGVGDRGSAGGSPDVGGAQFKVSHLMVSYVRGELGEVTGRVTLNTQDIERSVVVAQIDVTKIDTRNDDRDRHLRSSDLLAVDRYPSISFRSNRVRQVQPGRLEVFGDLSIRGVTREVRVDVELSDEVRDPWANVKRGVVATARIDRKDFGVSWNAAMDGGGIVVGDIVDITIELELVRVS